jgi:hypothetical protein
LSSHNATLQRNEVMMFELQIESTMTAGYNLALWVQQCHAGEFHYMLIKEK